MRTIAKKEHAKVSHSDILLRNTRIELLIRNPPSFPSCELFPIQLVGIRPPLIAYS